MRHPFSDVTIKVNEFCRRSNLNEISKLINPLCDVKLNIYYMSEISSHCNVYTKHNNLLGFALVGDTFHGLAHSLRIA